MKPTDPYPLCRKHGITVDDGCVPHSVLGDWRKSNPDFFKNVPSHEFIVTVSEAGIPACDVERWLALATGVLPTYEWD